MISIAAGYILTTMIVRRFTGGVFPPSDVVMRVLSVGMGIVIYLIFQQVIYRVLLIGFRKM